MEKQNLITSSKILNKTAMQGKKYLNKKPFALKAKDFKNNS
jgi:hypothetical protein